MKDEYSKYKSEEMAATPSFIEWVRQGQPKDDPWSSWVVKHPKKQEDIKEAVTLVQTMKFADVPVDQTQEKKLWDRIDHSITAVDKKKKRVNRRILLASTAVAATITLLVITFLPFSKTGTQFSTHSGEMLTHEFPDRSKIHLNAESQITYDENQWAENRTVQLEGEGYFEVEKGNDFIVSSAQGEVKVLGTSFNILDREGLYQVQCISGSVSVSHKNSSLVLSPGQSCRLSKNRLVQVQGKREVTWLNGVFTFENVSLDVVFGELERQYKVEVNYPEDTGNRLFTGNFNDKDLEEALHQICWPMGITFNTKGKIITIE